MRPTLLFLAVAATLVVAVSGQDRHLLAQTSCSGSSGLTGNATSYSADPVSGSGNGTICFKVSANAPCDNNQTCCLAAGDKHPKLKFLILKPPAGSTCAQKELRKLVKWTVAGGKPKKAITDGSVIKVKIAKLDPVNGGLVCVDLSASGSDGCKNNENLCKGGKCDMQLLTGKFKKNKDAKRGDCCSSVAAGGNTVPSLCLNITCPAPTECESAGGVCDEATGLCGAPTIKPNGTSCSNGTCQGGVCTPRCTGVTCPPPTECESAGGVCDAATGVCGAPTIKPNGTTCSNGTCQGGVCTAGLVAYVDCSQPSTDSLPCFVAASASSGLCINSTCIAGTSTISDLMAPEVIGLVEDLIAIDGNTTGDGAKAIVTFNTPIEILGRLLLAAPSGFTRTELTLPDGSNVTVDYSEFEGSAFVSDASGQEFLITAPQNGSTTLQVLYYNPATGLVNISLDVKDLNLAQAGLSSFGHRRHLLGPFFDACVPDPVDAFCDYFSIATYSAGAAIALSSADLFRDLEEAETEWAPGRQRPATAARGVRIRDVFDTATGKKLFDIKAGDPGGCIPVDATGYGQVTLTKPYTSSELRIDVSAPCEGTAWEFTMACAAGGSSSSPSLRLPQQPSPFRERGVQYEKDYKKSIGEGGGGE
ncbi:hypothetical protein Rsub_02272 [Raphidocelis subcapitata]|uniref:Uncharacterized protein n=1 Tax=Raphidocelis subcapitata TaxID=307507 RepID=A0A2V0NPM1_9CHLO|nr:hypothetical protein Rsub_02272 [Raphidocelis subcapitata]|eukprot:GBF89554.1 hypothetical protein Rsub_02272 [Raphidocelis subcapitata]